MTWFDLAKLLIPVVGAVVPGAGPLVPLILAGITEAQALHDVDHPLDKKAHVLNVVAIGAAAATATGKVRIDPAQAAVVTNSVFDAVDAVHAIVKAQPKP